MRWTLNIDIFSPDTASFVAHVEIQLKQKEAILLGWEVIYLSSELPKQWEIEMEIAKKHKATEKNSSKYEYKFL